MTYIDIIYLKRLHSLCRIQFQTDNIWFVIRKIEKKRFLSTLWLTDYLQLQLSQNYSNRFQIWVALNFWKVLKIKVTKGKLIIPAHLEMAHQYLQGGPQGPPLPFLGLRDSNFAALWPTHFILPLWKDLTTFSKYVKSLRGWQHFKGRFCPLKMTSFK